MVEQQAFHALVEISMGWFCNTQLENLGLVTVCVHGFKKKTRIWLEISNSGHAPNGIPSFASCIRMCGMSCKVWQWNLLMFMLREMWISSLWEYIHLWFLVIPLLGILSCISPQQEVECGFSFHCYVTMARCLPQLGYNIIISPWYIYIYI